MNLFRLLGRSVLVGALCGATLAACSSNGSIPATQTEQKDVQSVAAAPSNQPLTTTLQRRGFGRFLAGVTLSDEQQAQLKSLMQQFRQAHPPGSAFNPQALQALHEQMMAVLSPAQQAQVQQNFEQRRGGWMPLNLTDDQRAKIHQLMQQFRQAHPAGSAVDPQARQQLHQQIFSVLTPQQQAQLQTLRQSHRGMMAKLNLTDRQRAQIGQLIEQFRQAHPRGSAVDPQARQQLHEQMLDVLTPQQRAQLQAEQSAPK